MNKTATSIYYSGIVLMIFGLTLMLIPQQVMIFFWNDFVFDFWLRTLGYFIAFEGFICYKAAKANWSDFFNWIKNIRVLQPFFFITIILNDFANPGLLLYSSFEIVFGVWTFMVYSKDY